jgi:hypothetical protein
MRVFRVRELGRVFNIRRREKEKDWKMQNEKLRNYYS